MKKPIHYLACFLICIAFISCSEEKPEPPDLGRNMFGHYIPRGLTKTSEDLMPGYAMFAVPASGSTYLVNREGQVVHEWKGTYSAFNTYLMDDGSIFNGSIDPDYPVFGFGGPYGRIQKISWDGKILWDYELANEKEILHHDFAVKPNGNLLAIVYDAISPEEALELGRMPHLITGEGVWLEKIFEIQPESPRGGKVVWEWHIKDHLVQDQYPEKLNFGDPAAHPEWIDFNVGDSVPPAITQDSLDILVAMDKEDRNRTTSNLGSDIYHFNAINYNPILEQIALSSPELSEVFILDQSTTTEEAASYSGGKSGRGGDFLFRWGNPENYRAGDSTNRQLYYQHDVRWIEPGKPGAGNLTLFNNGYPLPDIIHSKDSIEKGKSYSMIYEISPPMDAQGNYIRQSGSAFGPEKPTWFYRARDTLSFWSSFISGAHRMKNGNTFINEGAKGRFMEVTPEGDVVWEYLNPYRGNERELNGDPMSPMPMAYSTFRATFIPADHPGLQGRELVPLDPQPEFFKLPPPEKKDNDKP
jgi:hypothetical protein